MANNNVFHWTLCCRITLLKEITSVPLPISSAPFMLFRFGYEKFNLFSLQAVFGNTSFMCLLGLQEPIAKLSKVSWIIIPEQLTRIIFKPNSSMKKITLLILAIAGSLSVQSCKDQFEDLQLTETKTESKIASKEASRKVIDSTNNLKSIELENAGDPPIRHGGQW